MEECTGVRTDMKFQCCCEKQHTSVTNSWRKEQRSIAPTGANHLPLRWHTLSTHMQWMHTHRISCMADATEVWTLPPSVFCILTSSPMAVEDLCKENVFVDWWSACYACIAIHHSFPNWHRDRDMFLLQVVMVDKYWYIHFMQNWSRKVWSGGGLHLIMEDSYTLQTEYGRNHSHNILYKSQDYAWPSHATF
jgi:hypothetical protein